MSEGVTYAHAGLIHGCVAAGAARPSTRVADYQHPATSWLNPLANSNIAYMLVALDVSTKWKLVSPRFLTEPGQLQAIADAATVDPDATPAPARMWRERRAKKRKASETAADITDVKRRAAKKWLRGVTGCLGLQC